MDASKSITPRSDHERSRGPSVPAIAPTAGELPVTRTMLGEVRTELLDRIDQVKNELKAEFHSGLHGVQSEIHGLKGEIYGLKGEIHSLRAETRGENHSLKADMHGLKAEMARVAFLVEEQNARNKIVLDALTTVLDRQNRVERRVDDVEDTVRALASARPAT